MDPVLFEIGPIRLWYYGLAYAIGFLTINLWVGWRRQLLGWSRRDVLDFSLLFTASSLLGGRAFDIAFYERDYYGEHPWQLSSFWQGGMATHGVLLGAAAGTALFCWWRDKSFLQVADEMVIPGAFLLALGRVGNHINGEVYGYVTDVGWAVQFPYTTGYRHPVALYEGIKNLLLVPILLYVRKRNPHRPQGLLLGHFVFWYGFLRLFADHYREYEAYWLGIGTGQYFNLLTAAVGLGIIFGSRRIARREPEEVDEPRGGREEGAGIWVKETLFYALVAFCLLIPSGTTQQVLKGF
jgi:phosphatidylglycerol---prolipoprotein diacylglyceryl transferase